MNKVICDICGTAYPDTAPKCPICGYAKVAAETTAAGAERRSTEGGYSAVKGGRFSKQNVRKRTTGTTADRASRSQKDEGGNTGLILVVIFLAIAIIAVVAFICVKMFGGNDVGTTQPPATVQVTQPTTQPTDPTVPTVSDGIACTGIQLSNKTIEFINVGDTWTIQVNATPANTTDEVVFESSNPEIVSVDKTGLLTAVGSGEATITVKCGTITETCVIKCSFEMPSVPPTEPTVDPSAPTEATTNAPTNSATTPTGQGTTNPTTSTNATTGATTPTTAPTVPTTPVNPNFTFAFNTKWKDETSGKWDTSILEQGKTWKAYKNDLSVDPGAITWTCDDTSVCTVENGIVTAVAPGKTEIHATYGGKTYTCIVRCKFEAGTTGGNTNTGNTNTGNPTGPYTLSAIDNDMTVPLDDFWYLRLLDANGKEVNVTWTAEDGSIVSPDGNKMYGEKVGKTNVSTTYEGVTYTCIVRVKPAQ